MPGDDLTGAYLASLRRLLPAGVTEEVAGGLADACASYRACGYAEHEAAEAAIEEFGEAEALAAAFTHHSAGRRIARATLATGPPVGAAWGIALITARAWTWSVPATGAVAFGLALLLAIVLLAVAATARSYARTRLAAAGCSALIVLDMTAILAVIGAPEHRWMLAGAAAVSTARIAGSARVLPRVFAR